MLRAVREVTRERERSHRRDLRRENSEVAREPVLIVTRERARGTESDTGIGTADDSSRTDVQRNPVRLPCCLSHVPYPRADPVVRASAIPRIFLPHRCAPADDLFHAKLPMTNRALIEKYKIPAYFLSFSE